MNNCKQCKKQIESKTGRRPKVYCSPECRTTYGNAHKNKDRAMVKLKTHEALLAENKDLKEQIAKLLLNNPVFERQNPLVNAARGRDESGINEDEVNRAKETPPPSEPSSQEEIVRLKGELALITGKSDLANHARKSIQKKIDRLEKLG